MPRKQVTEEQLLELINAELRKNEECTDCRFTHIHRQKTDEEGCNWSVTNLRCSGTPASVCTETADFVARDFRSKYVLS